MTTPSIPGLDQQLKPFYAPIDHGRGILAKGKVFIDGDCWALRMTATGHFTLRNDWSGLCERVDKAMQEWRKWDIATIMFNGQGPEIDRVGSQQETDDIMRVMSSYPYLGGRPNVASAVVYDYLREQHPKINVVATPTDQKQQILASSVYQYALHNRDQKVFLLATDNTYAAYHWPENVYLVKWDVNTDDWVLSMMHPSWTPRRRLKLHCFELAFLCKEKYEGPKTFKDIKKWLRTNDKYHKWREDQRAILQTMHVFVRPYKHVREGDCFEVQRALNNVRNKKTLYKQLPLMNEPLWAESAFIAGRHWRSLAYELMIDRVSYLPDNRFYFVEGRREGTTIAMTKVPICDRMRALEPEIYPPMNRMLAQFKCMTSKTLRKLIMQQVLNLSPNEGPDERLNYDRRLYQELLVIYMRMIWEPELAHRTPGKRYLTIPQSDELTTALNPTALRLYNKFCACIYSLILLQNVVELPQKFRFYDLNGMLWIQLWNKYVGEPAMTSKQLAAIQDPPRLTDQFYSYHVSDGATAMKQQLFTARDKCARLIREKDEEGLRVAEQELTEIENKMVEFELDRQDAVRKVRISPRLLMLEHKKLETELALEKKIPKASRFNLRLMQARLTRVYDQLTQEYFDVIKCVEKDDKVVFKWRKGRKQEELRKEKEQREKDKAAEKELKKEKKLARQKRAAEKAKALQEAGDGEDGDYEGDTQYQGGKEDEQFDDYDEKLFLSEYEPSDDEGEQDDGGDEDEDVVYTNFGEEEPEVVTE